MSQLLTSRVLSPSELNDQNFSEMYSLFSDYFHSKEDIFHRTCSEKTGSSFWRKREVRASRDLPVSGVLIWTKKEKR